MTSSTGVAPHQMYAASGSFFIRNLGDEEWVKPDHFPGSISVSHQNVMKPIFVPGGFSFIQYTEEPRSGDNQDRLGKDLYMWRATFDFADLYDIRVTEYKFGQSAHNTNYRIRIELTAACKVPPAGQGLVTAGGVKRANVLDRAVETSVSVASSVAVAKIADRWRSGNQEIKLTFTRTTQLKSGSKLWIWDAFLAFVCGVEWAPQNRNARDVAAQKSLKEVVNARVGNLYVEFERKEDDWILIKPKSPPSMSSASVQESQQQQGAARGLHFGTMQSKAVASPSRIESPVVGEVTALGSLKGKRKAVEQVESSRSEKMVRLESQERLRKELAKVRGERDAWQAAESHARDMAEKAAEKERELQLRIDTLDP